MPARSDHDIRERRRRLRRRRRIRAVAVLPTLCTLGNLIAGFAAIHFASKPAAVSDANLPGLSSLTMAGILIFTGMFFDTIDGYVARLTKSMSEIGAQLDSLADIVTFGVAPAYMTLQLVSKYYLEPGSLSVISPAHDDLFARVFWMVAAIYVACTALRLARFNVETGAAVLDDHLFFRGLPSPGAAGCVASLILLHEHRLSTLDYQWIARATGLGMTFILLLCALAMVSRLPYVHFANRYIRGHASFGYVVKMVIILAFALSYPQEALAVGFTVYALSSPVRSLSRIWSRRAAPQLTTVSTGSQ